MIHLNIDIYIQLFVCKYQNLATFASRFTFILFAHFIPCFKLPPFCKKAYQLDTAPANISACRSLSSQADFHLVTLFTLTQCTASWMAWDPSPEFSCCKCAYFKINSLLLKNIRYFDYLCKSIWKINKNLANLKGKVTDLSFETFENFKNAHLADHLYSYIRNKK